MQNNNPDNQYTYTEAGFNRFFKRSYGSDRDTTRLQNLAGPNRKQQINFDSQQVEGAMGDLASIGKITLDGKLGAIIFHDERGEVRAIMGFEEKQ